MYRLVTEDIEIEKRSMNTDDAIALFHDLGMEDKEKLFKYRRSSRVNIYVLDHYKDYFYGFMVPSTGYLRLSQAERERKEQEAAKGKENV